MSCNLEFSKKWKKTRRGGSVSSVARAAGVLGQGCAVCTQRYRCVDKAPISYGYFSIFEKTGLTSRLKAAYFAEISRRQKS